jgi:PAS domain S-box-containing protein
MSSRLERSLKLARPKLAPGIPVLVVVLVAALMMAALLAAQRSNAALQQAIRLTCIVPVALAAYRKNGLRPGMAAAAFYSSAFLWQAALSGASPGYVTTMPEAIAASVFLFLIALVTAWTAETIWAQSALGGALTGSSEIIARSADLSDAAAYVERVAASVANAESAALLLRHPLDGSWRAYRTGSERLEPPPPGQPIPLAWWLVEQGAPQRLNRMEDDPRFAMAPDAPVRSLVAHPLRERDGKLAAMLVLLNRRGGGFSEEDAVALALRAMGAGKALEQAGLYARTDAALNRRAGQLTTLQVAARQLNAELDLHAIARCAAASAAELTGADGGLAVLGEGGVVTAHSARGVAADASRARAFLEWAASLESPALFAPSAAGAPALMDGAAVAVAVPILRGEERLGVIVVADRRATAFDARDLAAAAALADHTAVAVENARLFADILSQQKTTAQIIETLTEGLVTTDAAGLIREFNPAAESLTGISAAAAVGQPFEAVLGACDGPGRPVAEMLHPGRIVREARWELTTAGGRSRVLSLSTAPLPGDEGGMVVAMRDITEREAMERFQRELAAAFSHGLRTPLANIALATDLLLGDDTATLRGGQRDRLEVIRAQVQRLAEFTQRTLDVQRQDLESLQLEVRPIPIGLEVEEAAARARGSGRAAVSVSLPRERAWAWADEAALQTVLDNLLDNALRYSPEGNPVELHVERGPEGYLTLAVLDCGPGIPEAQRDQVFQRFYRADGADPVTEHGHGMGLYISRRLVERMGGRIWMETRPEGGSRFAFTLPAYTAEELAGEAGVSDGPERTEMTLSQPERVFDNPGGADI